MIIYVYIEYAIYCYCIIHQSLGFIVHFIASISVSCVIVPLIKKWYKMVKIW